MFKVADPGIASSMVPTHPPQQSDYNLLSEPFSLYLYPPARMCVKKENNFQQKRICVVHICRIAVKMLQNDLTGVHF